MVHELQALVEMLTSAGIPFEICSNEFFKEDGIDCQICYPTSKERVCDAICHPWSKGYEEGLLEIMGLVDEDVVGDEVEGYLTAEEVFCRIEEHWKLNKK